MNKRFSPYLLAGIGIVIIMIWHIFQQSFTLVHLSDSLFLAGLPFLIIGSLLWIFSSGFFDTFQRSMHEALRRDQKKKSNYMPLSEVGRHVYRFWLIIAGMLIGLSLLLLLLQFLLGS